MTMKLLRIKHSGLVFALVAWAISFGDVAQRSGWSECVNHVWVFHNGTSPCLDRDIISLTSIEINRTVPDLDQSIVAIQKDIQQISGKATLNGAVVPLTPNVTLVCSGYVLRINYTCLDSQWKYLKEMCSPSNASEVYGIWTKDFPVASPATAQHCTCYLNVSSTEFQVNTHGNGLLGYQMLHLNFSNGTALKTWSRPSSLDDIKPSSLVYPNLHSTLIMEWFNPRMENESYYIGFKVIDGNLTLWCDAGTISTTPPSTVHSSTTTTKAQSTSTSSSWHSSISSLSSNSTSQSQSTSSVSVIPQSTTNSVASQPSTSKDGFPVYVIGIIVAVVLSLVVIIVLVCWKKKKACFNKEQSKVEPSSNSNPQVANNKAPGSRFARQQAPIDNMPTNEANKPKNGLPPIAHIPKNKVAPIARLDETVDANKASLGIDNQFESDNRDRGQDDKALNKLPPLPSSGNVNVAAAFSPGFPSNVAHDNENENHNPETDHTTKKKKKKKKKKHRKKNEHDELHQEETVDIVDEGRTSGIENAKENMTVDDSDFGSGDFNIDDAINQ